MNMGWTRLRGKILHKILGEYLIELQSIEMLPDVRSAFQEYLQILRERNQTLEKINFAIRDVTGELKLIRATQS